MLTCGPLLCIVVDTYAAGHVDFGVKRQIIIAFVHKGKILHYSCLCAY